MAGKEIKFQLWVDNSFNLNQAASYVHTFDCNGAEITNRVFYDVREDITPAGITDKTVFEIKYPMPINSGIVKLGLTMVGNETQYFLTEKVDIIQPEIFTGWHGKEKDFHYLQLDYKHYENVLGMVFDSEYYTTFIKANLQDEDTEGGAEVYENDRGNGATTQRTPKQYRRLTTPPYPDYYREFIIFALSLSDLQINKNMEILIDGDVDREDLEGTNMKSINARAQILNYDGFTKQYNPAPYMVSTFGNTVITEDEEITLIND